MKSIKAVLLLLLMLTSFSIHSQTDFCKGWKDGYKEGYCYGKYGCVSPVAPVCPVPNVGEDNYKGGYNRGFLKGKSDQNGSNSGGGAYGQLKPIQNSNIGQTIQEHTRYWAEQNSLRRSRTREIFNIALKNSITAFNNEDYWECIKQYNQSKDLGWYDNKFEFAAGVSYAIIWMESKDEFHYKMAYKLIKQAIKHGNGEAKKILKQLKEMK